MSLRRLKLPEVTKPTVSVSCVGVTVVDFRPAVVGVEWVVELLEKSAVIVSCCKTVCLLECASRVLHMVERRLLKYSDATRARVPSELCYRNVRKLKLFESVSVQFSCDLVYAEVFVSIVLLCLKWLHHRLKKNKRLCPSTSGSLSSSHII